MSRFSVVVPVRDGERYLEELLAALQAEDPALEVLVIDSASSDRSVAIARAAGAEVLEIAQEDFGHGRTRNLGAERTDGELICFLTQDATPLPGWLAAYEEAFTLDPRVGAAYGPHLPRPDTSPMVARELEEYFAGFAPEGEPVVQRAGDDPFLSNVNACYSRACWEEIRFADVPYAEDQAFGIAMLQAGWAKVFHPGARVLHAHDYTPLTFMRRHFDEFRARFETSGEVHEWGVRATLGDARKRVIADDTWMRERGVGPLGRARWLPRSAVHHLGRRTFAALGSRAHRLPPRVRGAISLERRDESVHEGGRHMPARLSADEHAAVARVAASGPVALRDVQEGLADAASLELAVVIPPFQRGSGGHMTIFRLVRQLEALGHRCSIWLDDPGGQHASQSEADVRREIVEHFQPLDAAVHKGLTGWRGTDVVLATGWQTVHPVLLLEGCGARAYLVQDHEPEFYATSAESTWAADTYRHGLYPISASPWLRDLVEERYGASGGHFDLGVDHETYRPLPAERGDTVVFYARGVTERRAVPLGVLALDELRRRRPGVRLVLFGDGRPPATAFHYDHLGVASPSTLAQLYAEARAGLVLSLTNISLVPFEMLACGLPCVELAGGCAEAVLGADGPAELAPFDPLAVADALERLLDDRELWERRSLAGLEFTADRTWQAAGRQLEAGLREALRRRPEETHPSPSPARASR